MFRMLVLTGVLVGAPMAASAQQQCNSDAQQVVDRIYRQVLLRPADGGSVTWTQKLTGRTATVRDLVRDIAKSPEYSQRFFSPGRNNSAEYERAIDLLYQRLMNRAPDPADRRAYAKIASVSGIGAVVDDIVSSPDYDRAFGDWNVPGARGIGYCPDGAQNARDFRRGNDNGNGRFRGMDRDNDGVISRQEWRGSEQSFRVHDQNRDGVLSGNEARDFDRNDADGYYDRRDRFDDLDVDRNGRIEWREWHSTVDSFEALDRNHDSVLSRAEIDGRSNVVATSGRFVTVGATERWHDTGISVRAGDAVYFDASGNVQLSPDPNDSATPDGSRSRRLAPDAPVRQESAGGLVARIGNSAPIFIGSRGVINRAPASGRLYLTVNDDYLGDNSGQFQVNVDIRDR